MVDPSSLRYAATPKFSASFALFFGHRIHAHPRHPFFAVLATE
jgi:hypothetical protein